MMIFYTEFNFGDGKAWFVQIWVRLTDCGGFTAVAVARAPPATLALVGTVVTSRTPYFQALITEV
jgi:hypothetical protein